MLHIRYRTARGSAGSWDQLQFQSWLPRGPFGEFFYYRLVISKLPLASGATPLGSVMPSRTPN
jgi:hypothetical protein